MGAIYPQHEVKWGKKAWRQEAMSALENEIIENVRKLDDAGKQRILAFVEQELRKPQTTLGDWLERATAFREEMSAKYGVNHFFNVQSTLDELREEASWPR
jgi:hypothetical protein